MALFLLLLCAFCVIATATETSGAIRLLEKLLKRDVSPNQCSFTKHSGFILYGHNDMTLEGYTLEECKDQCLFQIGWQCFSFDYSASSKVCYLSSASHLTAPDSLGHHWDSDYYHKVCPNSNNPDNPDRCPQGYFQCADNEGCITSDLVCDGQYNGCLDRSDEWNCIAETSSCMDNEYRCPGTDMCILLELKCDGMIDCPKAYDEDHCSQACGDEMFMCVTDKQCIEDSQLCDRRIDCEDGSDERDCNYHCQEGQLKCRDSDEPSCIPSFWQCDGEDDCAWGTDEKDCD